MLMLRTEPVEWSNPARPIKTTLKPIIPNRRLSPEQELMLAVLRQALDDYGRALTESNVRARHERYAIERWIFGDDLDWPFSYLNVCQGVAIDPGALRAELRQWRHRGARSVRLAPNASRPFRLPNRAMRGSRTRVGAAS